MALIAWMMMTGPHKRQCLELWNGAISHNLKILYSVKIRKKKNAHALFHLNRKLYFGWGHFRRQARMRHILDSLN